MLRTSSPPPPAPTPCSPSELAPNVAQGVRAWGGTAPTSCGTRLMASRASISSTRTCFRSTTRTNRPDSRGMASSAAQASADATGCSAGIHAPAAPSSVTTTSIAATTTKVYRKCVAARRARAGGVAGCKQGAAMETHSTPASSTAVLHRYRESQGLTAASPSTSRATNRFGANSHSSHCVTEVMLNQSWACHQPMSCMLRAA
mmetsp:Transcript_4456/g.12120  ORF Transcript_4456/g.12120 Transcript_4456/m.12120 type:complete len:203 (+) Transcript_4456:29-637(+)